MKLNRIAILLCTVLMCSCSEYSKLVKSSDVELKLTKAKEYYEKKKYLETATLLEPCIVPLRGTEKGEEALYLMASSYFYNKDYISARSYFSGYTKSYPRGQYAEECKFMAAMCYYKDSPEAKLDQVSTVKAIDEFGSFIQKYPNSIHVAEATSKKQELTDKLAYKAYLNSKLYFRLGNYQGNNYKACIITANNALKDYPESIYREELAFLILNARYHEAVESVASKQMDRFRETVEEYHNFTQEYPDGQFRKNADEIYKVAQKKINGNN